MVGIVGVPSAASIFPDYCYLLLLRSFALVCRMLCVAISSFFALLRLCSKVAPVWVLAACSLGSCLWGCLVSASFCIELSCISVMNEFQFEEKKNHFILIVMIIKESHHRSVNNKGC